MQSRIYRKACLLAVLLLMTASAGCAPDTIPEENDYPEPEENEPVEEETVALPELDIPEGSVKDALYHRISRRDYTGDFLDLNQVGILVWSAGGLGVDAVSGATRTAPSAGATYPLDIYLVAGMVEGLETGVYRYEHQSHALEPVAMGDRRAELASAALDQQLIAEAPVSVVLVAHYERTTARYGERGERYVHMDAGYASQGIHLVVEELDLGTVAIGAFDDADTAVILETAGDPLMIMPVGVPR